MIKKNYVIKLRQRKLFFILFLFCIIFSFFNLFEFLNFSFYPEYFIALMVLTISSNMIEVSSSKIFIIGILVDILIGSILGQYTLAFLLIYSLQILSQKYFMPSKIQTIFLRFLSVGLGVIIVSIISQKFNQIIFENKSNSIILIEWPELFKKNQNLETINLIFSYKNDFTNRYVEITGLT